MATTKSKGSSDPWVTPKKTKRPTTTRQIVTPENNGHNPHWRNSYGILGYSNVEETTAPPLVEEEISDSEPEQEYDPIDEHEED